MSDHRDLRLRLPLFPKCGIGSFIARINFIFTYLFCILLLFVTKSLVIILILGHVTIIIHLASRIRNKSIGDMHPPNVILYHQSINQPIHDIKITQNTYKRCQIRNVFMNLRLKKCEYYRVVGVTTV